MSGSRRRIASAQCAVEFSTKRLDAENQKMAKGTTTGFAILEAQKDLTTARTQELSAISDFNRSARAQGLVDKRIGRRFGQAVE